MYNIDDNIKRYNGSRNTISSCNKCSSLSGNHIDTANENSGNYFGVCGTSDSSGYGLRNFPLASVYAPMQDFAEIYDCETGISRGTIFRELDLPFVCGGFDGGVSRG